MHKILVNACKIIIIFKHYYKIVIREGFTEYLKTDKFNLFHVATVLTDYAKYTPQLIIFNETLQRKWRCYCLQNLFVNLQTFIILSTFDLTIRNI